jgi:hypothetical protein
MWDKYVIRSRAKWVCVLHIYDAFFDETGTHDNSPYVGVGGFLFKKAKAVAFERQWRRRVKPLLPDGVEAFHAFDCFHRLNGYEGLDDPIVKAIFVAMTDCITKTARYGVFVGIARSDYNALIKQNAKWKQLIGEPYALCALQCAEITAKWLQKRRRRGGIDYIYEQSHLAPEAMRFLQCAKDNETIRQRHQMNNFSFFDKSSAIPLQAADLLAWEFYRMYITATDSRFEHRPWRETLKNIRAEVPLGHQIMNEIGAGMRGMINAFYSVYPK